jgi:hypothetical protein
VKLDLSTRYLKLTFYIDDGSRTVADKNAEKKQKAQRVKPKAAPTATTTSSILLLSGLSREIWCT